MSFALTVDIVEQAQGESFVPMSITFFGDCEADCEQRWEDLKKRYEFFAAADREGRTLTELDEIDEDELPDPYGTGDDDT